MPAYKEDNGTWCARFYTSDYYDNRIQKKKRGFKTKREALEYEREFLTKTTFSLSMSFQNLYELYMEDLKHRVKLNTFKTKLFLLELKILPFFKNLIVEKITPVTIRQWQNEIIKSINPNTNEPYSQTYIKTINNQLVAIFNYAVRFHGLQENPCHKAGTIGKKHANEMNIWTLDKFNLFVKTFEHKPLIHAGFHILFWCGLRIGELLALTFGDINFEKKTLTVNKSYQRIDKKDVIADPKTPKSNRIIQMPDELINVLKNLITKVFDHKDTQRIFLFTNFTFEHSMKHYSNVAGIKKIRIHDLRHSHASLLIHLGVNPLAVSRRLGHEKVEITLNIYSHLYPNANNEIMDLLNKI